MSRTIIVEAEEQVACPKRSHRFPLTEGISRQAIERHAEELERSLAGRRRRLEAGLAAEARARFDAERKALEETLRTREGAVAALRSGELELRRRLRELEDAKRGQDLEYQRKLDAERKRLEAEARLAAGEELGRREAQRKAQLESVRRAAFPLDEIVPVPKG